MRRFAMMMIMVAVLWPYSSVYSQAESITPLVSRGVWSEFTSTDISRDGKWVSYALRYDNGADTLFLKNVKSGKRYLYPSASKSHFSPDGNWFAVLRPLQGLIMQNLANGKDLQFKDATEFDLSPSGEMVLIRSAMPDLLLVDLKNGAQHKLTDVQQFKVGSSAKIAIIGSTGIRIIDPHDNYTAIDIVTDAAQNFKALCWNAAGTRLAFMEELPLAGYTRIEHRIYSFDANLQKLVCLDSGLQSEIKGKQIIAPMGKLAIQFAQDDSSVLFYYGARKPKEPDSTGPEVWDTATPLEYPAQKYQADTDYLPKLARWIPENAVVMKLGSEVRPSVLLLRNQSRFISFNKLTHEPQMELEAPVDIYISDPQSPESTLLVEKQHLMSASLSTDPTGRLIGFFHKNDWWIYNIKNGGCTNLTSKLNRQFHDSENYNGGEESPYGCPGWSADGQYLIVYDKTDVWLLPADGGLPKRITEGWRSAIRFRLCENSRGFKEDFNPLYVNIKNYDLSEGLLLEATGNDLKTGYFIWEPTKALKLVTYGDYNFSRAIQAKAGKAVVYIKESAQLPPRLMLFHESQKAAKLLRESNVQQAHMPWTKVAPISYQAAGRNLKGALYYPAGYQAGKKYPMVVLIYERLSHTLHRFYMPGWQSKTGFNPANYFLDGYLVLLPDIEYEIGEIGNSALACVTNAVNEVISMGIVDEDKIGIIGHSFGGYEVSYIIGQTSLFKAAVAGAGITDLLNNYLSMHWETEHSNMWRYEYQQLRMGSTPFNNLSAYINNSPVVFASQITTPLLSWTGKEDINVPSTQSMELHLALRRLNKQNVLLVYPGEGHVLVNPDNQKDLGQRIKRWFDHYLK